MARAAGSEKIREAPRRASSAGARLVDEVVMGQTVEERRLALERSCSPRTGGGLRTDADFAAAFAEGEDFAGIEGGIGIEGVVDAAHEIEVGIGEEERHEFRFFHAYAVLAGERAADFDAIADDLCGGFEGALELRGVAGIVENDGVQVAVASVEDVTDLKAVLIADLPDAAQRLRKFRTRDDAVEDIIAGSQAAECAESVLAAFPEEVAFCVVACDADFAGMMRGTNVADRGGLSSDGFSQAFHLNEQNSAAVHRKTGVDVVFDGAKRPAIEHFTRGRSDGASGDVHDGVGGIIHGIENGEKCLHGFGLAREFYGDFGDEGKRAAGKSRASAAAYDGDVVACSESDDARDLLAGIGKNDEIRTPLHDGAVVFIKKKILRPVKDGRRAEEFFEFANKARVHGAQV